MDKENNIPPNLKKSGNQRKLVPTNPGRYQLTVYWHKMATDLVYSPDPGSFVQQQPDTLLIATPDSSQQGRVFILQSNNKQILTPR